MSVLRWPLRLLIPLAVAGALVLDARSATTQPDAAVGPAEAAPAQVTVPGAEALTSSWFCPAVGLRSQLPAIGEVTSDVLLTNTAGEVISVSVEFRGRTTGRRVVKASVAAHTTAVVRAADYVRDEVVGALIEASAGGLAVTRRFESPLGIDEARCSSALARNWFVPVGDTQSDAATVLAIMNPLPRDAIVDVTFATETEFGPFVAPELTGVVVPKSSTSVVDVGAHARRRDVVAAAVETRTGRVAVDVFGAYDGSIGRRGFAAELATAAAGRSWLLPSLGIDSQTSLWVRVFNPSDEIAEVSASVNSGPVADASRDAASETSGRATGDTVGSSDALSLAVPARDVAELRVEAPGEAAPGLNVLLAQPGVPLVVSVRSANDVPLVVWAELLVGDTASPLTDIRADAADTAGADGPDAPDAREPSKPQSASGLAYIAGIGQARDRWLVAAAPEPGVEASVSVAAHVVPLESEPVAGEAGGSAAGGEITAGIVAGEARVNSLVGEMLARFEVPSSGATTHQVNSGAARLVVSDGPVAVLVWQVRSDGSGVSVSHPLGY